eukprot:501285_1
MSSTQTEKRKYKKFKDPNDCAYRPPTTIPKKPKDINAPKRGMSAYFLFAQEIRSDLQKENKGARSSEIAKLIVAEWNEMSDNDKKEYGDQAKEAMDIYKQERAEYEKSNKYKKYKRELAEWNDTYKEEAQMMKEEKQRKKKEKTKKKNKKDKKKNKKNKSKK